MRQNKTNLIITLLGNKIEFICLEIQIFIFHLSIVIV